MSLVPFWLIVIAILWTGFFVLEGFDFGVGFAGLFAVRMLARAPVQVTLIDRAEHHLFQPMLYQCATGRLSEGKIAAPLRQLLAKHSNVEFVIAEVTGIDAGRRQVLARRPLGEQVEFGYDYLILAAGVRQSYFGHDEYAPIAPGMKTIEDAMKIRRRIFGAFEMAESAADPAERARWLTFALVGAGPTGVELAGQIREVATKTLRREYRHIKPDDARVLLFDGGSAPLAMFGPKLSALAARDLGKLGVELHMGSIVTHVDQGGLEVKDHDGTVTRYETWKVLWTAGVEAPPLATAVAKAAGAQQDRAGRIVVGLDLSIAGHPEILVTGRDEPRQAARGGRGRHADRAVRRAQGGPSGPRPGLRQAVQVPRPGLGRLHLPRHSRRLGVQDELRRRPRLVVRVHPRPAPGTDLHHRRHAGGRGPVRRQPARSRGYRRAQRAR
jgi:NADH dehydrogenase FAD-containing subunit